MTENHSNSTHCGAKEMILDLLDTSDAVEGKKILGELCIWCKNENTETKKAHKHILRTLINKPDLTFKFLSYLFRHRYEYMDKQSKEGSRTTCFSGHVDCMEELDLLIGHIAREDVCEVSLKAFQDVYEEVSTLPVVRSRIAGHVMLWISNSGPRINTQQIFRLVENLLVTVITDVWSAVRKTCCSRLTSILEHLVETNMKSLYERLVKICLNESSTWQAIDGAILGITVILNEYASKSQTNILPKFIKDDVLSTVLSLISHPQLTIREKAAKSLLAYTNCLQDQQALLTFQQIILLLNKQQHCDEEISVVDLLEPYKAEGLLNICSSMIKVLPLKCLLPEWLWYVRVFTNYLSHQASTVRQTASLVFQQLFFKADANPVLFRIIMSQLISGWPSSSNDKNWEGKEGRMFVYELICEYLVKNHWLNTFGPLQPTGHGETRRLSNTALPKRSLQEFFHEANDQKSSVWNEMLLELKDKSLLEQSKLCDHFTLQHNKSFGDFSWNFMEKWLLSTSNGNKICPLDLSWLKTVHVISCDDTLKKMLHQSIECLTDGVWELGRISNQVLPLLCEVIRWYDVELNIKLIDEMLQDKSTESSLYTGTYLLKESVEHCVRLLFLLQESPKTWKDPERCCKAMEVIVKSVEKNSHSYMAIVEEILMTRETHDKLSNMALEIMIILQNQFGATHEKIQNGNGVIFSRWQSLFQFSHPTSQISHILPATSTNQFLSPQTGYLSCCMVQPDGQLQCARQVEKNLILLVYEHLTKYFSKCTQPCFLPIVSHYIGQFADDSLICKEFIQCLMVLCERVVDPIIDKSVAGEEKPLYLKCVYYALKELAGVIAIKTFDVTLLQRVLSGYVTLSRPINPTKHLPTVLKAICSRLNKERRNTMELSPRLLPTNGTVFGMPPYFQGEATTLDIEAEVFDEKETGSMYTECLSLSGGIVGSSRRRTLSVSFESKDSKDDDENGEESDWDSWSDEEENDTSLSDYFKKFLVQMKDRLANFKTDVLQEEIEKLKKADQDVIKDLLK